MAKRKVLYLTPWYPNKANSAAGIFVKEQAHALNEYHEVGVVYVEKHKQPQRFKIEYNIEDGLPVVRVSVKESSSGLMNILAVLRGFLKGASFMAKKGFKPDVIHSHVYYAGLAGVVLGKLKRLPVLITEHSSIFPSKKLNSKQRLIARLALGNATRILPVSEFLLQSIREYGIDTEATVVPNVVNTDLFYYQTQPEKKEKYKILFVALLNPIKGLPILFEALQKLTQQRTDFQLDIVGDGAHREEYEQMVQEMGLSQQVIFHGLKSKQEVASFMRQCDFFISTSYFETFGCVVIEALASGKAVLATNSGGPAEIIDEHNGILVPKGDPEALYAGLLEMLQRLDEYKPEEIRQDVVNKYSYQAIGEQLSKIINEVVGEK